MKTMKTTADYVNNNNTVCSIDYPLKIVWRNVIAMIILHVGGFYGFYLSFTGAGQWKSFIWAWIIGYMSSLGVQCGAHRLWTHRSYKAKWQLRLILAFLQTMALQNDLYEWCRDHRVHHKFSETNADPHNSNRGFFFSHMGWLLCKKHPAVKEMGKTVDMSDVLNDPIVRFQRRFYIPLVLLIWGFFPISVPIYFFGESLINAIYGNFFRYVLTLHFTWTINSFAHLYGNQPYDKKINARDNVTIVYASMGEGYHNYHHTFPWDYSASEYGWKDSYNPATAFIDFFAAIGWAYDRKVPTTDVIEARVLRTGDGKRRTVNTVVDFFWVFMVTMWPIYTIYILRLFLSN